MIDAQALRRKLALVMERQIKLIIPKVTARKAEEIHNKVKLVSKIWRRDVLNWMTSPTEGMPVRRSGELSKALHYTTRKTRQMANGSVRVEVHHSWAPTTSRSSGEDYGSIINAKTRVKGYRERIKEALHTRIENILKR